MNKSAVKSNSVLSIGFQCNWIWFNALPNSMNFVRILCEVWFCWKISLWTVRGYNFKYNRHLKLFERAKFTVTLSDKFIKRYVLTEEVVDKMELSWNIFHDSHWDASCMWLAFQNH